MNSLFWTGYSTNERHAVIQEVQQVISRYGDLVDVHFFSDVSLSLRIEIIECNIEPLYHALTQLIRMETSSQLTSTSKQEIIVLLNISFGRGTGNLKQEIPAVPG